MRRGPMGTLPSQPKPGKCPPPPVPQRRQHAIVRAVRGLKGSGSGKQQAGKGVVKKWVGMRRRGPSTLFLLFL